VGAARDENDVVPRVEEPRPEQPADRAGSVHDEPHASDHRSVRRATAWLSSAAVDRRTLAHTDLVVSRACLGTMPFGSQTDEQTSLRMIDLALDAGVDFFDTANVYSAGRSEQILGKALRGRRDQVVLATKVRSRMGDGPDEAGLSRAAIRRALDDSLRRLATEYVDVYYLHQPDDNVPIEESLGALDEAVQQGKVRYPASSNYSGWQVCEMLWIAERARYRPAWITQPMYNLLARGIEQEYLPMAAQFGVSTVVYNPLAGGLLTGKQRREAPLAGSRFDRSGHRLGETYLDRYWHDADFDAVAELGSLAESTGRPLIELAFAWLLHHTPIDCVVVGASSTEQLEQNLSALASGPLTQDVLDACDRVWSRLRGVAPQYNR
jgi:aryl-alcohol dehydrogenase-like predicted oxidoreductase